VIRLFEEANSIALRRGGLLFEVRRAVAYASRKKRPRRRDHRDARAAPTRRRRVLRRGTASSRGARCGPMPARPKAGQTGRRSSWPVPARPRPHADAPARQSRVWKRGRARGGVPCRHLARAALQRELRGPAWPLCCRPAPEACAVHSFHSLGLAILRANGAVRGRPPKRFPPIRNETGTGMSGARDGNWVLRKARPPAIES